MFYSMIMVLTYKKKVGLKPYATKRFYSAFLWLKSKANAVSKKRLGDD